MIRADLGGGAITGQVSAGGISAELAAAAAVAAAEVAVGSLIGGGGSGLEYEEGIYTPESNVDQPTILFSRPHAKAPVLIVMMDATGTLSTTLNRNITFEYIDLYQLFGEGYPYSSSAFRYGLVHYFYRGSSTSINSSTTQLAYTSDTEDDSGNTYPRYWATETGFKPGSNSTSRYWSSARTYKWIAVWAP